MRGIAEHLEGERHIADFITAMLRWQLNRGVAGGEADQSVGHIDQRLHNPQRDIEYDDRNRTRDGGGDDDEQQDLATADGILGAKSGAGTGVARAVDQASGGGAKLGRDLAPLG